MTRLRSAIQALLVDRRLPSEQKTVVFTMAPGEWASYDLRLGTVLVDVSAALGIAQPPVLWHSVSTETLAEMFVSAGWSPHCVMRDYRPDLTSHRRYDLVLLGHERAIVAAVELKSRLLGDFVAAAAAQVASFPSDVPWVIATDGLRFALCETRSKTVAFLNRPPSPPDLGLVVEEGLASSKERLIVKPPNWEELETVLMEHKPQELLIDHSLAALPFRAGRGPKAALAAAIEAAAVSGGPVAVNRAGEVLLILASKWPGVERVSTVVVRQFLTAPRLRTLRTLLRSRLPLAAVIELPSGTLAPSTTVAPAVISLERGATDTYFDVVTSTVDLQEYQSRAWFASAIRITAGPVSTGSRALLQSDELVGVPPTATGLRKR